MRIQIPRSSRLLQSRRRLVDLESYSSSSVGRMLIRAFLIFPWPTPTLSRGSRPPQRCIKQHAVQNIIQERRLLEEIECPFVCNLRYAFQDDENLFMVLDLMLGGDLRFHLDRMGYMSEDAVRFLMAEMAIALDYLHRKGIVHR